jgi:uncharacterized protein
MAYHVSLAVARRFLAIRHLVAPPRALPPDAASVMAVVDRLGSLQFDPLEVAGRNHDLVLQARIGGYRRELTDELLYGRRLLFEGYNKSLNLLPTRELPYYRIAWQTGADGWAGRLLVEQAPLAQKLLAEIEAHGPRSSTDFERGESIDWWWGPTTAVRAVLEAFAVSGRLGLARRDGNRRYYDLIERLFPTDLLAVRVPEREQRLHKLLSRYRAHGLLGSSGSGELWLGIGPAALRAQLRAELVERGELVAATVDGLKGQRFIVADELPLLAQAEREVAAVAVAATQVSGVDVAAEAAGPANAAGAAGAAGGAGAAAEPKETPKADAARDRPGDGPAGASFLAPLDPILWDREALEPFYDFEYRWEVYTPANKRRWGYYVLPILFGDRLVGRIEPRFDRAAQSVRILGLSWEAGFDPIEEPGFVDAFAEALTAYLAFGAADTVARPAGAANAALFREISDRVRVRRHEREGVSHSVARRKSVADPA